MIRILHNCTGCGALFLLEPLGYTQEHREPMSRDWCGDIVPVSKDEQLALFGHARTVSGMPGHRG